MKKEKTHGCNGKHHEQRHVAPFMYAGKDDISFVLQFRLVRPLDLPRLPKEFDHTGEPAKEYKGPDGEFLEQRPYFMPSMKSLVAHLEQRFIGFRFVYFDYKAEGVFHKYRFVFSKKDTRDETFRKNEKDLRQLLQNLMKRPSITANGGVRTYRNHAVDEETGELIPDKTWVSVGITDEVVPGKNKNGHNGKNGKGQKKSYPRAPKPSKLEEEALRFVESGLKGKPKKWGDRSQQKRQVKQSKKQKNDWKKDLLEIADNLPA